MRARYLSVILVLIAVSGADADDTTIRVGLVRFYSRVSQLTVSSSAGLSVADAGGTKLLSCKHADSITISAEGGDIVAKCGAEIRQTAGPLVNITPLDQSAAIRVASANRPTREYRGCIEARPKAGALQLVNVVAVEDYLLACVPEEMPSGYPVEAIKAQAIAARTFALHNRGKHASDDYDLCDTTNCQLYGGVQCERPRTTEAVGSTRGIVVAHGGQPASVMYSADCGGVTACGNGGTPYPCAVVEPDGVPHCTWEVSLTTNQLAQKLIAVGVKDVSELTRAEVVEFDKSGRAVQVALATPAGAVRVSGSKFRSALASCGVKSQLFTLETVDGTVVIKGKGSGHGVGLCQVGAKWLASSPQNYTCRQILTHYFPGTELAQLGPPDASATRVVVADRTPETKQPALVKESPPRKIRVREVPPLREAPPPAFDVRLEAPEGLSF